METNFPYELQKQLEQAIVKNEYTKGEVLTSSDLAEQFDVTPDEMLLVLRAEHRKGLVVEQKGDAFEVLGLVGPPRDSVFTHTKKLGFKPTSEVREVEVEPATSVVAQKLEVEVGAPVYRFVRTRNVNEEALANQTNYIPFEISPGLEHDDVFRSSFQKLLEEKYFAFTGELKEDFEIVPATEQDMEILSLPQGSSILWVQRLALSVTGYPLVWANIRIRPDRYQYVSKLWPTAAALLAQGENDE